MALVLTMPALLATIVMLQQRNAKLALTLAGNARAPSHLRA